MPTLDLAYLRDLTRVSDINREWETTVLELEEVYVREKLKDITKTITSLNPTQTEQMQVLQNDFGKYSRRLTELTK